MCNENFKGTVKSANKWLLTCFKSIMKFRIPTIYNFAVQFLLSFLFIKKTLWLKNLKPRTAKNAKISVFLVCVEAIVYLLLYNLDGCTFNIYRRSSLYIKCIN